MLVNTEGTGFYRVAYERDLREALVARAQADLSPIERYGLVDDAWAAVLADQHDAPSSSWRWPASSRPRTTCRCGSAWSAAWASSTGWSTARPARRCAAQVLELVGPELGRLGREPGPDDTDRDRERRGVLVEAAGVLGADPDIEIFARGVVARRRAGARAPIRACWPRPSTWWPTRAGPRTSTGSWPGSSRATNPQEELRYLYALAAFDQAELVDRLVAMCLTDEIRSQNAPYVLGRAMANRDHGPRAWAFVRDHWDEVNAALPVQQHRAHAGRAPQPCGRPTVADDVFAFFEDHEVPQGDKQLAQHLERLEVNVALRARAGRGAGPHHLPTTAAT